ncbi:molybdenum-pterin binding protein [Desulfovibrio sp. X2]|uniref:TOBE domain-containing protein n=1 Tax=Desulfovibrio sp. X2 TaxID=941449 RepID=UPI000358910D|nr:TOBE domain-containing protein [Desulfovibrio sp. X2]EPR41215.1 molybdenum-pterin binding protein [Desulfovibrio sp. X2]
MARRAAGKRTKTAGAAKASAKASGKTPGTARRGRNVLTAQAAQTQRHLDTVGLAALEQSFRAWAAASNRPDVALSRRRMLCVFLLLRASGARLGEVLGLDERADVDCATGAVRFAGREVQLSAEVCAEVAALMEHPGSAPLAGRLFSLDQGQVRRTFAQRAAAAGLPRELSSPTVLRRSRAVEMLGGGVPLSVVQKTLGQSSPSLTAAWHGYSEDDARRLVARFMERERRRTSARNAFFGRITGIRTGEVQALVEVEAVGGQRLRSMITVGSVASLGLHEGAMVTAEIKAPWVLIAPAEQDGAPGPAAESGAAAGPGEPAAMSAENRYLGVVREVHRGSVTTEVVTELADGTAVCAVVTTASADGLSLVPGRRAWVFWSAFAVILNVEQGSGPLFP